MGDLRRRTGKVPDGVRSIYPSASAPRSPFVVKSTNRYERCPASEAETREIRCAQCGQPIEDHAAIATCPFCESDNFLGHVFDC